MALLTDIADAVWTATTRTTDSESVGASDGSYLDDIGYAVWTEATRTVDSTNLHPFRLRFQLDATGDPALKNFTLKYRRKPLAGEWGVWNTVT